MHKRSEIGKSAEASRDIVSLVGLSFRVKRQGQNSFTFHLIKNEILDILGVI